jgi:hypothetical protein
MMGRMTEQCASVIKAINTAIRNAIGDRKFVWGSLQINYNTVSQPHEDKNNVGDSMMFLLGDFTFGAFRMSDSSVVLSDKGVLLALDGTKTHESDRFEGQRYSVVAFLHKAVSALPRESIAQLIALGFVLPSIVSPTVDDVSPTSYPSIAVDDCERTLVEICCSTDSVLGRECADSKGCRIVRITEKEDFTLPSTLRVVKLQLKRNVLVWASLPCTGGCPWARVNLLRLGSTFRERLENHWTLFRALWANFVCVAEACIFHGGFVALEWPRGCSYWRLPEVVSFLEKHLFEEVIVHGCAVGLASINTASLGKAILKPWRVVSNCPSILRMLDRQCCGGHEHARCEGVDTKHSEGYTPEFASLVHRGFRDALRPVAPAAPAPRCLMAAPASASSAIVPAAPAAGVVQPDTPSVPLRLPGMHGSVTRVPSKGFSIASVTSLDFVGSHHTLRVRHLKP